MIARVAVLVVLRVLAALVAVTLLSAGGGCDTTASDAYTYALLIAVGVVIIAVDLWRWGWRRRGGRR